MTEEKEEIEEEEEVKKFTLFGITLPKKGWWITTIGGLVVAGLFSWFIWVTTSIFDVTSQTRAAFGTLAETEKRSLDVEKEEYANKRIQEVLVLIVSAQGIKPEIIKSLTLAPSAPLPPTIASAPTTQPTQVQIILPPVANAAQPANAEAPKTNEGLNQYIQQKVEQESARK